jgi:hypothetical protein
MEASEKTVILHGETGTERDTEREREKKNEGRKKSNLARHHIAFDLLLRAIRGWP